MWGYGPGWGMGGGWGGWGWFGGLHMIIWLLLLVLVVVGIVWVVRGFAQRADTLQPPTRRHAGLDVLEERYARGEISRDEYMQKKRDIVG